MDFITAVKLNSEKLSESTVVTQLWKEIIEGQPCQVHSEQIIEYSFHYPVDTEIYLQELNQLFEDSPKEDLRSIDGNLKAYLMTFLYYCTTASDRMSLKTSLYAGTLYMKIISLHSGLGQIYFEKNMYRAVLQISINSCKKLESEKCSKELLSLIHQYCKENTMEVTLFRATANTFASVVMYTVKEKLCNMSNVENITIYSLNCLEQMITNNEDPDHLKVVMCSLLRCLRQTPFQTTNNHKKTLTINTFKMFISTLLNNLDENKVQYLLDALFVTWGELDFDSPKESVAILNTLKERYYKDVLRRIPNYLNSKNHKTYHLNLMDVVYEMYANTPPFQLEKLVFSVVCLKSVIMHFLSKNKQARERSVETIAKIFCLNECPMLKNIFQAQQTTGKFATLDPHTILNALCICATDTKWTGGAKIKNLLIIVSKILTNTVCIETELSSKVLLTLLKDCTPFVLKPLIGILHELYIKLSERHEIHLCKAILTVFLKNALHQDQSSQSFVQHLYSSLVAPSTVDGVKYPPTHYINVFLTKDFDYEALFKKCAMIVKHDHVTYLISKYDYKEPGHPLLLNCLLNHVCYKETNQLLNYILDNFSDLCMADSGGALFCSFKTILHNKTSFNQAEIQKVDVLHGLLWEALFDQMMLVSNVKASYELIQMLRAHILNLQPDPQKDDNLFLKTCEKAFKTSMLKYDIGSVMYLTEICLVLKRVPEPNVLDLFKRMLMAPDTINLLRTSHNEYLIQMMSFFATIAIMSKNQLSFTIELLLDNLRSENVIVKIIAIKLLYTVCTEVTHEYDEVAKFVFKNISDDNPCLSRICVTILEMLIHDNYVLLTSTDFLRFVYRLGCQELHVFMKCTLDKRFITANKNDIGKYYMSSLVSLSGCNQLDQFSVSPDFSETLDHMRQITTVPNKMFAYLFKAIPIKTKFNILLEMSAILDKFMLGRLKQEDGLFVMLDYCLYSFEVMTAKNDSKFDRHSYMRACKLIEKQILARDAKNTAPSSYGEHERAVKGCTLSLLKFLFFIDDGSLHNRFKTNIGDVAVAWVEHMTPELAHYVHRENCKEFKPYLVRLVEFIKKHEFTESSVCENEESISLVMIVD